MKTDREKRKFLFQAKFSRPVLVCVLISLLVLSSAFAETAGNARLLFLGNRNIAPVVYLDNTTPAGVAVDIVQALAKHLSEPIEIKAMDWLEAQSLVARGQADALIQINETEERKKTFDFSDTLLESQFSIFTSANKVGISGISSLRGLRVGVESGGLPRQLLEKNPLILLTIIPDFVEGFKRLNAGTIDAVVVDYRVGTYILAKNRLRNIKVSGEPIAFSYSAIAVRKGNTALLAAINNALQTLKADGTYQKILDNWKPTEVVIETREQITQRIYYATIIVLLVLFLIAVIWTLTLRKELIKRKTAEGLLGEQHSTLRSIINSANALIFSVDRQYRYTSFNLGHATAMKALYGAEIELGRNLLDYMSVKEDSETARRNLDRALAGEQVVDESYSGEELRVRQYFQVSHSPVKTAEGIIGVAVLAQDMTERKRAEDALRRLNRELRAVSNCNQVLVRAEDEQTLLDEICRIVCEEADYRMAWVGYAENDAPKTLRPVAWAGVEEGYLTETLITWGDTEPGDGPGGAAVRGADIVCIQDFATAPQTVAWRDSALRRGYRSCIALPLKDENAKVFGVLQIYSAEITAFSPDEIRLLDELSGDLAYGITVLRARIERKQSELALGRANRALRTLSACNEALVRATTEVELLDSICRVVVDTGGYRMAWVGFPEQDAAKTVRPVAHYGYDEGFLAAANISWADTELGRGPSGVAIRSGTVQVNQNFLLNPALAPWRESARTRGYQSSIGLPLRSGMVTLGVLTLYAVEPDAFNEAEVALLRELAEDLAFGIVTLRMRAERDRIAHEHQRHDEILRQSLEDSIKAIADMVEKRDPYTAGHQRRVGQLAAAIARELGLPEDTNHGIELASSIHDLGKISIPVEILTKPGRLTILEFMLIKNHPQVGYDILKDIKFPWPIASMVLQHHERQDGSGYPLGLMGEEILLQSRILAVADVVESMASDRPYRAALGLDAGLRELERGRGTFYDTAVVGACLRLFAEKRFVFSY